MSASPALAQPSAARDYSETLFLPRTEFPMRAGLPQREPALLQRWAAIGLYRQLRESAEGAATRTFGQRQAARKAGPVIRIAMARGRSSIGCS